MIATTLEQSRKLVEIGINPDTADMHYAFSAIGGSAFQDIIDSSATLLPGNKNTKYPYEPAWSLSALLELLPDEIYTESDDILRLSMGRENLTYYLNYCDFWNEAEGIETDYHEEFVNTCVEMLIKLKEKNLI